MASPFALFRRNQKTLLAVLTLLAILAFLFLPPLMEIMNNRSARVASGVVATTKYEDIGPAKLKGLLETRYKLNRFMAEAVYEAFGFPMEQPFFGPTDEKDVVNALLMARKAEEMGIVVSDEAVRDFLRNRLNGRLKDEQYQQIMDNCNLNGQQLFNGLRQELMVNSVREALLGGVVQVGATPAQRWDLYQRLNRRAKIEAIGLKVVDFVKDVPDPDAQELARFFEKHKDSYWEPGSSEPGFHRPKRVELEYLKAERSTFFQPEAIAQADVEAHYEKHKDTRYLYSGSDSEPPAEEPAAGAAPAAETPASDAPAAEKPPAETPAADPNAEKPAGDQPPAETPAEPAAEAPQTPAPDSSAEPEATATPEAPSAGEDATPPGGGGDDAGAPATETPPEQPASETPATESPTQPAADAPAADAPAGDSPADPPVAVTDVPESTPPTEVGSDLTLPTDITSAPDPKYDPLWKVEDRIRRELAGERAAESMKELMRKLQADLNAYTTRRSQSTTPQEGEQAQRPDFSALAAANGLVAKKTDFISATEALLSLDIARSVVAGGDSFIRFAFEGSIRDYTPVISEDNEGNQYLFWKLSEQPDYVPKLEDEGIRDEVQAAWKTVKARDLALAKGNELLAQAQKSKELNLRERFSPDGLEVVEAGPFSWLTYGSVDPFSPQAPPRISTVPGLDQVGPEFMRQLFKLGLGDATVVMNNPQTVAYLVRLAGLEPSDEVLHAMFLADNFQRYRLAGLDDVRMVRDRWFDRLGEDAGLDWVKSDANLAQGQ